MSIFTKLGAWISKVWKSLKDNADTIAITITEEVKSLLQSGVLTTVAQIVENVLPVTGKIPEELVAKLDKLVPQILAVELGIQALPDNPTAADIQAFETAVLSAFNVSSDNSKLYTTLAAQIYGIVKADVDSGTKFSFAQLVADIEEAYQDYLQDQANDSANS